MLDIEQAKKSVHRYFDGLSKEDIKSSYNESYNVQQISRLGISDFVFKNKFKSLYEENNYHKKIFEIQKKATCFNQGEFIQYMFLALEKHKSLRENSSTNPKDKLEDVTNLFTYVENNFKRVTNYNLGFLQEYFDGRACGNPRISIKGKSIINKKEIITSLARDHKVAYSSKVDINKSTAFSYIKETGMYYCQNNIPSAAASNKYINARLDTDKVLNYLGSIDDIDTFDHNVKERWDSCWSDYSADNTDKKAYYKSTLVIPITLYNNMLTAEFGYILNDKILDPSIKSKKIDRTIFGFLCFDHFNTNYFDENLDVLIGYIFADWLSLYLFVKTMLLELSGTYVDSCKDLQKIDIHIPSEHYVYTSENIGDLPPLPKYIYGPTKNNYIASTVEICEEKVN